MTKMTMMMMIENYVEGLSESERSRFLNTQSSRKRTGGKRKRRTAYSSGRREALGMRRKKFSNIKSDTKGLTKRRKRKEIFAQSGIRRKSRFKRY